MGLIYEQLTYKIRGCIYTVHNTLGTGFDEESYQLALENHLKKSGIPFQSQVIKYVEHRGERVHKFVLDLIIDDKVILELKSIQTDFPPSNTFQILSYLKCWNKQLGLLVNFGLPKTHIKRIPFTEKKQLILEEDYTYIQDLITSDLRIPLNHLRESLLFIFETHGLGYGLSVYQELLFKELSFRKINFIAPIKIPVTINGQFLKDYEINWPIISNRILCGIAIMKEDITLDIIKTQTYLRALNLPIGLLAHFGKKELKIYGISP